MRIKDLSLQVPDLLQPNGTPYQWGNATTFSLVEAKHLDPTAGIRLWSPGDLADFWTPAALPDGYSRATRHAFSSAQQGLGLKAYRPRSQLEDVLNADPEAAAAFPGKADGELGQDRWFSTRMLFPPDFTTPTNPNFGSIQFFDWHGQALGGKNIGFPTIQFQLERIGGEECLTLRVAGGRWTLAQVNNPDGSKTTYPEPDWNYDRVVAPNAYQPPKLAFVEYVRTFNLLPGQAIQRNHWYKLVFHHVYHYDASIAQTELWIDGVKVVGVGGLNDNIDVPYVGAFRQNRQPTDHASGRIPNLWIDDTGVAPVSHGRLEQTLYSPTEDPAAATKQGWYDQAVWDRDVWTRAVWFCGSGLFSQSSDVQPTVPASVDPPVVRESWNVVGPSEPRTFAMDIVEELWSIEANVRRWPTLARLHDGEIKRLTAVQIDADGNVHYLT